MAATTMELPMTEDGFSTPPPRERSTEPPRVVRRHPQHTIPAATFLDQDYSDSEDEDEDSTYTIT
jgi:hypothetical protein